MFLSTVVLLMPGIIGWDRKDIRSADSPEVLFQGAHDPLKFSCYGEIEMRYCNIRSFFRLGLLIAYLLCHIGGS